MGSGTAYVCIQVEHDVTSRDINQKFLDKGMKNIKKTGKAVQKSNVLANDIDKMFTKISLTLDIKSGNGCRAACY